METKKFKPLFDKLYWTISIPTAAVLIVVTAAVAAFAPTTLLWMLPLDLFVFYFLISPIFGYVELREEILFIKYGFILKKEIPYSKIRTVEKDRKFYSESMMSLKNAVENVNIKYNTYDVTTVSVINNDDFILELDERRLNKVI